MDFIHYFKSNLVFVNEVDNDQATEAFEVALSYIKKNPNLGVSVDVIQAQGNRTDSKIFLDASKKLYFLNKFRATIKFSF